MKIIKTLRFKTLVSKDYFPFLALPQQKKRA